MRSLKHVFVKNEKKNTVELQWLEHLGDHKNMADRGSSI